MTTSVDQACEAAEQAKQAFFELDEMSVGYGNFDLRELQNSARRIQELLSCYRSEALQAGPATGELIKASILMQANQLEQVHSIFLNWLAEQQVRFKAYLVWVTAENAIQPRLHGREVMRSNGVWPTSFTHSLTQGSSDKQTTSSSLMIFPVVIVGPLIATQGCGPSA